MPDFDFGGWLRRLSLPVDALTADRLREYARLLREVNQQINLVSRKEAELIEERHLLHALLGASLLHWPDGARAIDVGTGGGLPGLALAILYPRCAFTLLDSTQKKIRAVEGMAATLGLANVRCVWARVEDHKEKYDYVTGRAVTALPDFWRWARPLIDFRSKTTPSPGVWYWKGGDLSAEIAALPPEVRVVRHELGPLAPEIEYYETKSLLSLTVG